MVDEESFDRIIVDLGDAVLSGDLGPWLAAAADVLGASKAALWPLDMSPLLQTGWSHGWTDSQVNAYLEYYNRVDIIHSRMRLSRGMVTHRLDDLEGDSEVSDSEIFNDFLIPADVGQVIFVPMDLGPTLRFVLGFSRAAKSVHFSS
ncbi:MAG: hypothetical protein KIS96_06930 [Bauldia sp.]|nr:hypothetical protein [Bauldia sp.]